jgi:TolB-like protein/Tfp pilus assembly protein PilF
VDGVGFNRRSLTGPQAEVQPIHLASVNRSFPEAELPLFANPGSIRDHAVQVAWAPNMAEGGDEKASRSTPPVFISYASQDAAVANAVVEALERQGVRCWIAPRDVVPGEFYAGAIVHAIDAAKVIVIVLSESAATSQHVLREVERASSKRHPVVAFRTDLAPMPAELEYFLNTSHWLDASAVGVEHALPKLLDAVQRAMVAGAVAPPGDSSVAAKPVANLTQQPPITRPASHRVNRPVLAVSVLVALGLGYFAADKLWFSKRTAGERPAATLVAPAATLVAPAVSEKSVAVLPFLDMSEKKDQEYFADGLSEELIDMLTKIPDLRVPARTSSFYFKGKSEDIPTIARRLMVAHVLEGSVRKYGNHLRVTAQLVRADNGYHLWSETYDRNLDDIFKVQDDIAGSVVKALKMSIMKAEVPRVAPTANSEAYTLYLQAVSLARLSTSADSLLAHDDLQRALLLDPKFALAWAALAELYTDDAVDWSPLRSQYGLSENTSYLVIKKRVDAAARNAAERALKLDPTLAQAHLAMARVVYWNDWNWDATAAELKKAHELDPGSAEITEAAADLAITTGRIAEGLQLAILAAAQDPLGTAYWEIGAARHRLGALDEAAAAYQHLVELYPTGNGNHFRYALALLSRHSAHAALDEMEREHSPTYRQAGLPLALDTLGRRIEADRELAVVEQRWGDGMAYQISYVYASRNDVDHAIYWLERAYQQHDGGLLSMKYDPMLTNVEHDLRYKALLRKMNLPE